MDETLPSIHYAAENGVARLTINHPAKMNAMTLEMWQSLPELVGRADADPNVRLIVLAGAGIRAFCAGADISQFGEKRSGASGVATYDKAVENGSDALSKAAKPTLASIRGICFGGGFALAMCCDLKLASDDSRFRIPAARLGLGYGFKGIGSMVRKIGMGPTAELLLTARIMDASDAFRLGIVNLISSAEQFETQAGAYIARIAGNAPLTLKAVKRALVELSQPEAERDAAAVGELVKACFTSDDYREGQAAFREKREPVFRGT